MRQYTGGNSEVEVGGGTAGDALGNLVEEHQDLKQHLYTGDGKLRSFVNVYKGDEDIRYLDGQDTEVSEDDELSIIPSIAGGRPEGDVGNFRYQGYLVRRGSRLVAFDKRNFQTDGDTPTISTVAERRGRALERGDRALQPAPDHAGGRPRRAEEAQGRQGA